MQKHICVENQPAMLLSRKQIQISISELFQKSLRRHIPTSLPKLSIPFVIFLLSILPLDFRESKKKTFPWSLKDVCVDFIRYLSH